MTLHRRTLLAGAAAAAGATAIAACSPNGSGTPGGGDQVTVRFSIWFGEGDIEVWKSVIAGFEKANPGIKIKFEPLEYSAFWTKLNTQFAGNSAPDVFGMQFQSSSFGPAGQLAPLTDAVAAEIATIPANLAQIGQVDHDGAVQQYALPWRFVGASLYANTTALQKAGIAVPTEWTRDDYLAAAKELTGGKTFGTNVPSGGAGVAIASGFGAQAVSDDGRTAMYNTPEMIAYKTFVRDLVHVHKVAPNPDSVSSQKDPFGTETFAMAFMGSWNTPVYRKITAFEWDILPNPSGERPVKNYAGPDMISVYGKSKVVEAATKFVTYAVFDRAAQELIGTTGMPVLTEYLTDDARIEAEAKLKPANYRYFVDQASENGAGWGFVPKFADIGKLEGDADFKILESGSSDIAAILGELNNQVQAALDSTK